VISTCSNPWVLVALDRCFVTWITHEARNLLSLHG